MIAQNISHETIAGTTSVYLTIISSFGILYDDNDDINLHA